MRLLSRVVRVEEDNDWGFVDVVGDGDWLVDLMVGWLEE